MSGLQYHFISGLPRSGSTLLSAILLQNPRFHAGMSSPVGSLFSGVLGQCSAGSEFGSVIDANTRRRLLRGLFDSYYADRVLVPVVFDTNRQWCARMPALHDLFPQAKVIACVRNVAWIMDSLKRLCRANPFENTKLFNDDVERNTVYSRVETLGQRNRLAYADLRNAYGQIFASTGLDPLPEQVDSDRVQSIATALAGRESAWAAGNIATPVPRAAAK